ncbi:MAG: hypothetical protein ACREMJ_05200 [Gemmatimonadales bacterium]
MTGPAWTARRLYAAVAACAAVVYAGALWNRFAMDDLYIIVQNPLVHDPAGLWRAFTAPYWPAEWGGKMYRPLAIATYALDWQFHSPAWFHAVNVAWHAGTSAAVAALGRRWSGPAAGLVAGLVFAVHPVNVEAVAGVVGRADLMAALFACLCVHAAVQRDSVAWSAAALVAGLLSKESAAVAPGLIVWAWVAGLAARPTRRRLAAFALSWLAVGVGYAVVRALVLAPFAQYQALAPVFAGASGVGVRLTAVAALADVARLLVFPLTLRVDYSPDERTLVSSALDPRFGLGIVCFAAWVGLLVWAWRRGRRVEAYGLGWIGVAFLPVANLLFPVGIVVAERTLYLPAVGLALAAGAMLGRLALPASRLGALVAVVVLAGGIRSALRVPVWRDDRRVTLSILEDSPDSYRGPSRMGSLYQSQRQPERALEAFRVALGIFDGDPRVFVSAADAAFAVGRPRLADSLLVRAEQLCFRCTGMHRGQARAARSRGDTAVADSLLARARRLDDAGP